MLTFGKYMDSLDKLVKQEIEILELYGKEIEALKVKINIER